MQDDLSQMTSANAMMTLRHSEKQLLEGLGIRHKNLFEAVKKSVFPSLLLFPRWLTDIISA